MNLRQQPPLHIAGSSHSDIFIIIHLNSITSLIYYTNNCLLKVIWTLPVRPIVEGGRKLMMNGDVGMMDI